MSVLVGQGSGGGQGLGEGPMSDASRVMATWGPPWGHTQTPVKILPSRNFVASYQLQRSCGQGNIFTPVCHSVQGGCLSACWDATPRLRTPQYYMPPRLCIRPGTMYPPDYVPSWDYVPPGTMYPLDYVPPWTTYPLGLCTPRTTYPPDYVPPGLRTPSGSRLQHMVYEQPVRILLECILVSKKWSSLRSDPGGCSIHLYLWV